jgi:hypothetical protein
MTKHQKIFKQMLKENEALFADFERVHARYDLDPKTWQDKFNQVGQAVMELVKKYEDDLCRHSEKGQYANFSANLAEKFWELVRRKYPRIDFVGVKISGPQKPTQRVSKPAAFDFEIKKISLLS